MKAHTEATSLGCQKQGPPKLLRTAGCLVSNGKAVAFTESCPARKRLEEKLVLRGKGSSLGKLDAHWSSTEWNAGAETGRRPYLAKSWKSKPWG